MEPLAELICRGLEALELPCPPEAPERWVAYARLLERWNRQINLTGHADADSIARELLLDAAALAGVLPAAGSIADVGSGAGIPGIPIALCRPGVRVLLVEARQRRHHFQRAAVRELGLRRVEPVLGRAERLDPVRCEGAVAQALARPGEAVAAARPWVRPGGWIAVASTPEAATPGRVAGLVGPEIRPYAAPGGRRRAAWLWRLPADP